jgi:hypothetical protein
VFAVKALLVVIAVAAPRLAGAKGCRDVSRVVGYSECQRFGWWSTTSALSWDAGVSWQRFAAKPIGGTPADDRPVTAVGFQFRGLVGFPHQLYLVAQGDLANMLDGPSLLVDAAARVVTTTPARSGGSVSQETLALGWRTPLGPLTVAGELGPGLRLTSWKAYVPEEIQLGGAWSFVLQARTVVDAPLSPSWSLGVAASGDVLHLGDYSVALVLGLHAVAYDGLH